MKTAVFLGGPWNLARRMVPEGMTSTVTHDYVHEAESIAEGVVATGAIQTQTTYYVLFPHALKIGEDTIRIFLMAGADPQVVKDLARYRNAELVQL